MGNVTSLNLANNLLIEVPVESLEYMPKLRTLSLGGNKIKALRDNDLKVRSIMFTNLRSLTNNLFS